MPPSAATIEARDRTLKESKRYLRDTVRNDWTFDSKTLQSYPPPVPKTITKWRPWDYDSSAESESEELQRAAANASVTVQDISVQNHGSLERASAAVQEEKGMTPAERKMKRQKSMEEEMTWNEGLRVWQARREAWAGARKLRDIEQRRSDGHNNNKGKEEDDQSSSRHVGVDGESSSDGGNPDKTVLPIAAALLPPSHPVRASITPGLYPSIYSKVVVQGLTPAIPINLSDMTRCLVQGWQADGQWPTRAVPPLLPAANIISNNNSTASRAHRRQNRASASATNPAATGVTTSSKHHSSPSAAASPTSPVSPITAGNEAPSSPESRRRPVGTVASAVKKVFHFPSIHRRNASGHDHSDPHGEDRSTIPTLEGS